MVLEKPNLLLLFSQLAEMFFLIDIVNTSYDRMEYQLQNNLLYKLGLHK